MSYKPGRTRSKASPLSRAAEILGSISDGFCALSRDWRFIYISQQVASNLGFKPEDLIGQDLWKKYPQLVGTELEVNFQKAVKQGCPQAFEMRGVMDNRWYHIRVYPSPECISVFWQDITRYKKIEEDLSRARDERRIMEQELKAYARKITRVQEEERKRIAYELHDDTAQYLSILKLQLDSLLHSGKIRDPEILTKLEFLRQDAGRAMEDVRRYSHELRPGVLDHLGLQAALEQIAEDINKLEQIKVEVNVEGEEPALPDEIKLGLFRIAQEALSNARKHAQTAKVTLSLVFQKDRVIMVVKDNGIGFNIQEARLRTGLKGNLGLMSMQERASLIGANLKIESEPGKGTTVTVETRSQPGHALAYPYCIEASTSSRQIPEKDSSEFSW